MTKAPKGGVKIGGGLSVWVVLKTLKSALNDSFFNYSYFEDILF
ncbi:hypothetical protein L934_04465 [Helicobacter pylori PZ5080]|uniref:Uncharacterized protein n=1 Tax=Helicobacter pylori PZ5080 TaxID=1337394 RepID=T2SRC9_HELPX|nr:hypothetical protein HPNQ4216_0421 [Helicobacter pylori NQ4216]EQD94938.1 hypothetical protein L934_04465 [Helicobacter pylori PZ5080]